MKRALGAIIAVCLLILAACADTQPERVMLDADCGWEEPAAPAPPFHGYGVLVILDSLDNYTEARAFTGIFSPEPTAASSCPSPAILLERNDTGSDSLAPSFPSRYDDIVSEEEDYKYLEDTLAALTFSPEVSNTDGNYGRVSLSTFEKLDNSWTRTNRYYICADGLVLKESEEGGTVCYYESLTPVDYYRISALEVKYSKYTYSVCWGCDSVEDPTQYRLCISSRNGHRDLTLEEAQGLLPSYMNNNVDYPSMAAQINWAPYFPSEEYLKITEYWFTGFADSSELEEHSQTFYLAPDGKLTAFRGTGLGHSYISQDPGTSHDWEHIYCCLQWVSEDALDYDAFLDLLETETASTN